MDRNRIIITVVILCVLVLLISLLAVFIPRSKMKENSSSSISNIATTESTILDITRSKNYTNDQSTVTITGKTQSVINNNIETSTDNQMSYWSLDASLNQGRSEFGSALLTNGRILIAGGVLNSDIATRGSEHYSSSSRWENTTSMAMYRYRYTLSAFANNLKALATGTDDLIHTRTAEVFDSTSNIWTYTSGNMSSDRYYHTATLLGNGQILIIGGRDVFNRATSLVEIYIPSTNSFINTTNMILGRSRHTSTLFNDGSTVLVTGGFGSTAFSTSTAELYIGGSWIRTNNNLTQPRAYHAAVLLNDGNVLIAGGGYGASVSYATAEIYNPTTRTFTAVSSMKYRRGALTLTLLPSGKVLATGGADWNTKTYPEVCELYDPETRTWSDTNMLNYGRSYHQTILLNDSVLTIGGKNGSDTRVAISEKYYF